MYVCCVRLRRSRSEFSFVKLCRDTGDYERCNASPSNLFKHRLGFFFMLAKYVPYFPRCVVKNYNYFFTLLCLINIDDNVKTIITYLNVFTTFLLSIIMN